MRYLGSKQNLNFYSKPIRKINMNLIRNIMKHLVDNRYVLIFLWTKIIDYIIY